jgi:hypothetical protein
MNANSDTPQAWTSLSFVLREIVAVITQAQKDHREKNILENAVWQRSSQKKDKYKIDSEVFTRGSTAWYDKSRCECESSSREQGNIHGCWSPNGGKS